MAFDPPVKYMHTDLLHLQRYHDSGDASAFQSLVRHHANMVFATARRITRDAALAEDVSQETFMELARKGRSITESVGAWLHRVAWRRACDVVRAESTRQRYEAAASLISEGRECAWEELEPVFDEALAELPTEERAVIIEHYLEGRTQTDIANRLGMSQSSVSRLLEQSLDHLRTRLKNRGVLCGAALSSMMIATSAEAAPTSLVTSLQKIALSSIGSDAATVAGGSVLATWLALNLKAVTVAALVITACAVGYDLASKDSLIARWFGSKPLATVSATSPPSASSQPAPAAASASTSAARKTKERLLADAKRIWAKAPKLSKDDRQRLWVPIYLETNIEKRFAIMRSLGCTLSRAEYDRVVARYPNAQVMGDRRMRTGRGELMNELMVAWLRESPLEATAWITGVSGSDKVNFPAFIAPWVRSHPEEWAAFVEAGPDPSLADYARLWVEDLDDPGSIWARAQAASLDTGKIVGGMYLLMAAGGSPDQVFSLIMRYPDAEDRSNLILGLAPKLSADQLHRAANSGLFTDTGLVKMLRAMAGDPATSFNELSAWVTKAANGGGREAQLARYTEDCAASFYEHWIKVDAEAALRHAGEALNEKLLMSFMETGAYSAAINETMIANAITDPKNRDRALAAYFEAKAGGDPQLAMQSLINSTAVNDQVESSQHLLTDWTRRSPQEAAAWVASLPASEDRAALLSTVAANWMESDPEAAFAFAQSQGLPLKGDWVGMFPFGARILAEEKVAPLLAALRAEPDYNQWMVRLARYRSPNQPAEAIAFMAKYGQPGWQSAVVADVVNRGGLNDTLEQDFALQLPTIDLRNIDPQLMAKATAWFAQSLANKGQLTTALDWTLKLPPASAPQARAEALAKVDLSNANRRTTAEQWVRRAPITEPERAALMQALSTGKPITLGSK